MVAVTSIYLCILYKKNRIVLRLVTVIMCVLEDCSSLSNMAYKGKKKIPELTLPTGNASAPADPGMSPSEM